MNMMCYTFVQKYFVSFKISKMCYKAALRHQFDVLKTDLLCYNKRRYAENQRRKFGRKTIKKDREDNLLYRCVNCGGNVVYDPAKKKMVCLSCGGSDCQELVPSQEPVICINCGSQIPYTEYQSAGRCPSCGTYLLRDDKVNYPYGADVILPFKISKHEAEEKLRNEFGKAIYTGNIPFTEDA